jgi:hypothetical protein
MILNAYKSKKALCTNIFLCKELFYVDYIRACLNFLFLSENGLIFFQMRQFSKGIAPLLTRKLTKYEE